MERRSGFTNNPKHVAIIAFAQSGFSNKCCPIAESQVLVVILDLEDRGGCWMTEVSLGMGFVSNIRRNMLFYSILQSLGGASYVARITLARKLIYNRTFLCGRNAVLLN